MGGNIPNVKNRALEIGKVVRVIFSQPKFAICFGGYFGDFLIVKFKLTRFIAARPPPTSHKPKRGLNYGVVHMAAAGRGRAGVHCIAIFGFHGSYMQPLFCPRFRENLVTHQDDKDEFLL